MTLTIDLPAEQEAVLMAKAHAQGVSAEEYARQVLADALGSSQPRQIWDVIAENMRQVPPEDLAVLPRDGATQIDHCVYGVPKRDV